MKARRSRSYQTLGDTDENQMNLTPLIDVVFVVLIMFIIVAPMLELDRVQLAPAAASEQREGITVQENAPIAIHVHEDNSIWVNRMQISSESLLPFLREAKKRHPSQIPQLFHDKKACFGTYQIIKNAAEIAGFEQLDVILQPS